MSDATLSTDDYVGPEPARKAASGGVYRTAILAVIASGKADKDGKFPMKQTVGLLPGDTGDMKAAVRTARTSISAAANRAGFGIATYPHPQREDGFVWQLRTAKTQKGNTNGKAATGVQQLRTTRSQKGDTNGGAATEVVKK